jgi:hypothetical protein
MLLIYAGNNNRAAIAARLKPSAPAPFDTRSRYPLQRLMDVSEQHLEKVARRGVADDMRVAQRILQGPEVFLCWEQEHTELMRSVAAALCAREQKRILLSITLSLLHRKSLFEYLRDYRVHDRQRQLLLMHFHGGNDYARAMVIEHGIYLRSAASYLCSTFLGLHLMHEGLFAGPLDEYAMLYAGYFAVYSKLLLSQDSADTKLGVVTSRLKSQLGQSRRALLERARSLH